MSARRRNENYPRALAADVVLDDDHISEVSDEGNDVDNLVEDDQSIIGPSISRAQTRLALPSTPAVEKSAILQRTPADYIDVEGTHPTSVRPQSAFENKPSDEISFTLPWSQTVEKDDTSNTVAGRRRAYTGPLLPNPDQHRKSTSLSSFSFSKLSAHRLSFPNLNSALSWFASNDEPPPNEHVQANLRLATSFSQQYDGIPQGRKPGYHRVRTPQAIEEDRASVVSRPQTLRRTTSDGSLFLQRSMSRASSLGDDTRWEDVHSQVNSRMKAIRDSLADSNFKLPKLPNLSNISLSSLSLEFGSSRRDSHATRDGAPSKPKEGLLHAPFGPLVHRLHVPHIGASRSPSPSAKNSSTLSHPHFSKALRHLKGDVIVLGGYRGSILRDTETGRQVWVPVKVGLNLRKVNLEVGLNTEDEENMESSIYPDGMLKNIGPVDMTKRLFKRLRASKNYSNETLRVHDYGYDWRLSPHLLSRKLIAFLEQLPCNSQNPPDGIRGAMVIAHSLGGLITRHAVNQRPDLFSGVLYAGTPQSCVNILGPLRNGDDVLLSSRVLTAQVNFTLRTSFALLPLDGKCFIDKETKEEYNVDFFDPQTWDEYKLSPCIARPLLPGSVNTSIVGTIVGSVTGVLPIVGGRKASHPKRPSGDLTSHLGNSLSQAQKNNGPGEGTLERLHKSEETPTSHAMAPQMDNLTNPEQQGLDPEKHVSTAVTLKKDDCVEYLSRTLAEIKRFKQELVHNPDLEAKEAYPPIALIYGKSTPTVYGAFVRGREGIKHADAYDDLAFASGDGVVLARAAQIPEGYEVAKGGAVSSDRGHVCLLGDLEAVGRCLNAIMIEQRRRHGHHHHHYHHHHHHSHLHDNGH